jgi:UDP-4-amino-4,6-dideoxy-N-acetyl-beta-L-altrosamine transaminase
MIPYGRQSIDEADIDAVVASLRSAWLTQGPQVPAFEQAVAKYCQCTHAVAVSNATAALHLACLALDIGPADGVWTSPNTFVASANCARYCGAEVDFVDIDPDTLNMSVSALADKLAAASQAGRLPKAIIPVHFSGRSCDMKEIARLARQHGIHIIEDASHAIGASYAGRPLGCCEYSDITVFSFHPVKIITSGEGGMALTGNPEIAARLTRLRSHGISRDPSLMTRPPEGDWYYQQIELGFNYRMTDIQAALGLSQLAKLDPFVERRRLLAERYTKHLARLPLTLPIADESSAWHLYVVQLPGSADCRQRIFDKMRAAGIGVNVHYIPVHLQPYYRSLGFNDGDFPTAEAYYRHALTLPLYPGLTDSEQDVVMQALETILVTEGF